MFIELYDNAMRDAERRPIGNIEAHALGRLSQSYMALKLVEAARNLGLFPEGGTIVSTRAMVQDKHGTREFPAAHRLPADLAVQLPDGSRRRLTESLDVALNQAAIDRDIFSRTDRLSRLANAVASGMSADTAMSDVVEPGYMAAIAQGHGRLERNMAIAERTAIATMIVDEKGEPVRALRDELRVPTADLENRARAKTMMEAILTETAQHNRLDPGGRRSAGELVRGIADNERSLGAGRSLSRSASRPDVLVPGRELPDLIEKDIADRLHGSARLAKRAEIESLSRLVFGNSQAMASSVLNIRDAQSGVAVGDDVREGRLGEMAGEGKGWLRGRSPARQAAEAHAPQLATALADYGHTVDFERHQIVSQHREAQARQRVEIPAPSSKLAEVLRSEDQDQVRRLNSEPSLRRELETITLAINRRLSPANKVELKAGDVARLATSLDIPGGQAASLSQVHEQSRALQKRSIRQNLELAQPAIGSGIGLRT